MSLAQEGERRNNSAQLTEFAVKDPVIFILSTFAVEKSQLFCHLLSEMACQK